MEASENNEILQYILEGATELKTSIFCIKRKLQFNDIRSS